MRPLTKGQAVWPLFLFLSLVLLTIVKPVKVLANPTPVFSAERAYDHVKYLVQKVGPRPAGSKAELKAAQYIYYTLEQNGWKVHEQPFSKVVVLNPPLQMAEQKIELVNSQNIIAELPGTKADTIILGAHYDSADVNAPGAVDNASGVGVLLELARVLAKEPHEETYQIVLFGAEERGLVGSSYYVSQADLSAVNWMLNLDMVGTPVEIDVAGKKSAPPELVEQITELARKTRLPFHLSRDSIVMNRDATQGGSSDFSSFLDQGVPAVGFGIAGRPPGFFHRPEDRIERVSLEELQKIGDYVHTLVQSVRLEQLGPRTWDELYLPFQMGAFIFILPSYGIRAFYLIVFLLAGWLIVRILRQGLSVRWKNYWVLAGVVFLTSLGVTALSGLGELVWPLLKGREFVWHAYPGLFLLARISIIAGLIIYLGSWFPRLPLPREPGAYWLAGAIGLFGVSLLCALIRIDLAFPLVFWLLCLVLQWVFSNPLLALIGPYFLYRFHWEMLNSNQWLGYYEALHRYYPVFIVLYTLLLIPFLLALLHVASRRPSLWGRWLKDLRRPALALIVISVLFLGLVPSYTSRFPQTITIREEWDGAKAGQLHIFSRDNFSRKLAGDLHVPSGKDVTLPSLREEPPLTVEANVTEKQNYQRRALDLAVQLKYARDPYLVSVKFESPRPFKITGIDEFLPVSKLPRKVQLAGKRQSQGNYILVMERTPPQRNLVKMSLEAESTLKCTVEVTFPDPEQSFRIQSTDLSIDYQATFKQVFEF
ncbi:MAG: M28 family metallopeptidase [Desulfitobacteriaceae bacterium]